MWGLQLLVLLFKWSIHNGDTQKLLVLGFWVSKQFQGRRIFFFFFLACVCSHKSIKQEKKSDHHHHDHPPVPLLDFIFIYWPHERWPLLLLLGRAPGREGEKKRLRFSFFFFFDLFFLLLSFVHYCVCPHQSLNGPGSSPFSCFFFFLCESSANSNKRRMPKLSSFLIVHSLERFHHQMCVGLFGQAKVKAKSKSPFFDQCGKYTPLPTPHDRHTVVRGPTGVGCCHSQYHDIWLGNPILSICVCAPKNTQHTGTVVQLLLKVGRLHGRVPFLFFSWKK